VIIPEHYDQPYWAKRIADLGIGVAHAGPLTVDSLTAGLRYALEPAVAARAQVVAGGVNADGARVAAERLVN